MNDQSSQTEAGQEFRIARVFDAPQDVVWKAWTELERLRQWWGPAGLSMQSVSLDLRPGGRFHYSMVAPDGGIMWGKWEFREITPQERLVYVNSFSDQSGSTVAAPFSDDWPAEILCTVQFEESGEQTSLVLTGVPINATPQQVATFVAGHGSMEEGFGGTLGQLDSYLATAKAAQS